MKKIIITIMLIKTSVIFCQNFETGLGFVYGFGNNILSTGPGLSILFSYKPLETIRLRTTAGLYGADFKGISPFIPQDNYLLISFEESIIYNPVRWDIEPYFGVGIGYYIMDHYMPGMGSNYMGYFTENRFEESKFAPHILTGLKLSAKSNLSFIVNFKYIFLKQHLDSKWRDVSISEDLNLGTPTASMIIVYNF